MNQNRPDAEYTAVCQEMLSLQQRAHEVWKWGIISLFLILGALLSTVLGLPQDSAISRNLLEAVAPRTTALGILLMACGWSIALTMVQLSARDRELVARLGAYLSIFHEGARPDGGTRPEYGWHVWNRIEKVADTRLEMKAIPGSRTFSSHGLTRIYAPLFVLYAVVVVLLCGAMGPGNVTALAWVAAGAALALAIAIELIERRMQKRMTWWNARWAELARADAGQLDRWLRKAWLVLDDRP